MTPDRRQPTLGKVVQIDGEVRRRQEGAAACACLELAVVRPRQDDVPDPDARLALGEPEQGPTGADLDVIGVGADGEQRQWPVRGSAESERQHA